MKTKITRYARLVTLTTITLFALYACEKDDDKKEPRNYVGEWETVRTVSSEDGDFDVQDVVNFNETSFTEVASIQDPFTDEWVNLIARKGDFTVKSGIMDITLTEVGFSALNDSTGLPTGDIIYYVNGTEEFTSLVEELEMSPNYKAQYKVTGNTLILKSDNNNNGSYDDEDESYTFTKNE